MKAKIRKKRTPLKISGKTDLNQSNVKKVVIKFSDIFADADIFYDAEKKTAASKTAFEPKKDYNPILPLQAMSGITPTPSDRLRLHGA